MLEFESVCAGYGPVQVLWDVTLKVDKGEVATLVGRNGVGKSTTLKCAMGLARMHAGDVRLNGRSIRGVPTEKLIAEGIGYVAQERELCPDLSVRDNLLVPLYANGLPLDRIERAYRQFPRLRERSAQRAGSLSGGERKMLAFARIMLLEPAVYLVDEPTEGLMPSAVDEIGELIRGMRDAGAAILLVEQNLKLIRSLSDRVYLMNVGRIEKWVDALTDEEQARYLGV